MSAREPQDMTPNELRSRVLYSLLLPVVSLAKRFRVPLKDVMTLVEMVYFHELRAEGLKLDEVKEVLGVSKRTAARLSKRLKSNFFRPEREHDLPKRIDFMLWAEPLSVARLARELDHVSEAAIAEALEELIRQGRVEEISGRVTTYAVTRQADSLIRPAWTARIGALNSLTRHLGQVVAGRFFDDDPRSFARTLTFRIRPEDLGELKEIYREQVWERLKALEEEAGDADTIPMSLSMCWAGFEDDQSIEKGDKS